MTRRRWLLAALFALGSLPGCPRAADPGPAAFAGGSEARPTLWALAPTGATFGLVVHDGAASQLQALLPFAEGGPLQELAAQLVGEISPDLPLNLVAAPRWDELGLDPRLGAALFSPAGEGSSLFVLPVGDRPRFRRAFHVQVKRQGGREIDEIGRGYLCAPAGGRYLCARTLAAIDQAVAPHEAELPRAIRALAPLERGEIEVWADAKAQEMQFLTSELRPLGDLRAASAVIHLGPSSLQAELFLAGDLSSFLAEALRGAEPPVWLAERLLASPGALRLHLEPTLLVARLLPFIDGEIRAALLDQLTGDLAVITEGQGLFGLTVLLPLRDPAPVSAALPALCATLVVALRHFGIEPVASPEGGCTGAFQPGKPPLPFLTRPVPLRLAMEGKALALRVGEAPAKARGEEDPVGAAARRILLGPETLSLHARALQLGPDVGAPEALHDALPLLDPRSLGVIEQWNRLGARLDALSFALGIRADGIRAELDLRSLAADPPGVRAAYEAALGRRFAGDAPGYRAALHALETSSPGTRAAHRARLVRLGGPWLGAGSLVLALLGALERR